MDVQKINLIFTTLRKTRGSIAKHEVIKQYADDKDFLEVCKFLYGSRITTGIAKKKMNKVFKTKENETRLIFEDLKDLMNYVVENNTGKDEVVKNVQNFINNQPEETRDFLKGLFIKDYPCGVSAKSVNDALGYELVHVHEVILGHKYSEKGHKVEGEFYITLKMDDNRATFCPDWEDGQWKFISRQDQPFVGLTELEKEMSKLPRGYVYDGGLISDRVDLPAKERFQLTGSILRSEGEKTGLWFVIYDAVPIEEWDDEKFTKPYSERREFCELAVQKAESDLIHIVELLYKGSDKEVIFPLLQKALAREEEGLMLNVANAKYEKKRIDGLLKIKEFYTADLRIIGYKEHKHGNKLGAFIVDYKGNPTNVGFGFSDKERLTFWENREDMIGKIIEVKYFQESKNKAGKESIRHGGFERLRLDKNEVSYS